MFQMNIIEENLKFHPVAIYVIFNVQKYFHIKSVSTFTIHCGSLFHITSCSSKSVTNQESIGYEYA
jgi:hypothetical protein